MSGETVTKVWGTTYTTLETAGGQLVSWVDSEGQHVVPVTERHRECALDIGYPVAVVAAIFSAFEGDA